MITAALTLAAAFLGFLTAATLCAGARSDAGKAALRAIGGWSRVAYAQEGALPAIRKAFLETYADQSAPGPQPLQLEDAT